MGIRHPKLGNGKIIKKDKMKVEINVTSKSIYLTANDIATNPEMIEKWVRSLLVARRWMRREIERESAK